jgi:DUF971 family protein
MSPQTTPTRLDLNKTEKLTIHWQDGRVSEYPLPLLRAMCPCAMCKAQREEQAKNKSLLRVLPGNYTGRLEVLHAELVGNYALRIDWSDQHGSGIYSFQYLRDIAPPPSRN